MGIILYFERDDVTQTQVVDANRDRSQQLAQIIENRVYTQWIDELEQLASILPSEESEISRFLESWIRENEKVICISVWIKDRRWPIPHELIGNRDAP